MLKSKDLSLPNRLLFPVAQNISPRKRHWFLFLPQTGCAVSQWHRAEVEQDAFPPKFRLHERAESGNPELVRYLLDKGFDPNAVGEGIRDMTPLMNAAQMSDSPEVVQMLIGADADVNKLDSFHRSALSWASYGENKDKIKQVLLKAGADPQKEGETGVFALNVMSQDLGVDPISRDVQKLADDLLRDRYSLKKKKKG